MKTLKRLNKATFGARIYILQKSYSISFQRKTFRSFCSQNPLSIPCREHPNNATKFEKGKIKQDLISTTFVPTPVTTHVPSTPRVKSNNQIISKEDSSTKTARENGHGKRSWKKMEKIICHLLRRPKWTIKDVLKIISMY